MRTKDIELANVLLDVYRIIGFHSANGFDRAICSTIDGTKEIQMFFDAADDSDVKDLAIYLSSLREHKGWSYSNEICAHLTGLKKFPLLAKHLCLSVYWFTWRFRNDVEKVELQYNNIKTHSK